MNAIDTNVFAYAFDPTDSAKQARALTPDSRAFDIIYRPLEIPIRENFSW